MVYIREGCTENCVEKTIMKYTLHCNVIEMKLIYIYMYMYIYTCICMYVQTESSSRLVIF